MKTYKEFINEGINDPAIFKAVMIAGGPGSGKSFIVGKTSLTALGFKLVNSDDAFEAAMKKAGLVMDPDSIFSTQGQMIRDKAKNLTNRKMIRYIEGRLGLVIDGTGKDYEKIAKQTKMLRELGYDVAMIFVNTDMETTVTRDAKRDRSVGREAVVKMWKSVQDNIGKFSNLFTGHFFVIDNSDGSDFESGVLSTYRKIAKWSKEPPRNSISQKWIRDEKARRNIPV